MIIHLFNPEHDLALAHNGEHFTPPHAARELRMNLGFIPALWAADGDVVLVEDVDFARKATRRLRSHVANVIFLDLANLGSLFASGSASSGSLSADGCTVDVWGWDRAVRFQLAEAGVPLSLLPTDAWLDTLRRLSHRATAVGLLASLRQSTASVAAQTVGESCVCRSMDDVLQAVARWQGVVLKSPWSSSGRGIKYVHRQLSRSQQGWCTNILQSQGCVVAELFNNKVMDFGMEFVADGRGRVSYAGLSLFRTLNGAYTGNLLATEADKEAMLAAYLPASLTATVRAELERQLAAILGNHYQGPLGIDMMVVARPDGQGFLLNPCVELNLRRTMGHLALSLTPTALQPRRLMQIVHGANYELKLLRDTRAAAASE